jgi:hypothetical protein
MGCLALKTVDCLMEKCHYEAGTEDVLIPTRRSCVIPETLAMITVPHAHTAYVQCGRADTTTSDIQTNPRIINQAALATNLAAGESSNEILLQLRSGN